MSPGATYSSDAVLNCEDFKSQRVFENKSSKDSRVRRSEMLHTVTASRIVVRT